MAIACTNCGHELPRDDAHFCNNCGTLVPSHPFSPQSLAAKNASTSNAQAIQRQVEQNPQKPVLREQMARSMQIVEKKPALQEQVVQQSRPRTTRRIAPENVSSASVQWPAPITHVSTKESHIDVEPAMPEAPLEEQSTPSQSSIGERELHVKVWEHDTDHSPTPVLDRIDDDHDTYENQDREDAIEDAPTTPLEASAFHDESLKTLARPEEKQALPEDVEQLDTVSLPKYEQNTIPQPVALSASAVLPPSQAQEHHGYTDTPIPYSSMPTQAEVISPSPRNVSTPLARPVRELASSSIPQERRVSGVPTPTTPKPLPRQKSRVPFIILLAVLVLLVLGCGAWVLLVKPFSIAPVTQPLQSFSDPSLHFAIAYPTSWTVQHSATGDVFADSSNTAVFKVSASSDAGDAISYMKQQATKGGLTATKSLGTSSFGGLVWQILQGSQDVGGANYTTTLYAASSGGRVYLLSQMAPQSVYADEDNIVFSSMRNSFKLL